MAEEETKLQREFETWKINTPFLYDLVVCHATEFPSLTVQWSPAPPQPYLDDWSFSVHRLLLGTYTDDVAIKNFLLVADAVLPTESVSQDRDCEITTLPMVEIIHRIPMDGEVNIALYMPQNPEIVAVKTIYPQVYLINISNLGEMGNTESFDHLTKSMLGGHDEEGYALSWSTLRPGYLLSAARDNNICIWDVSSVSKPEVLYAKNIYQGHRKVTKDASWHQKNENLFGSVGDDGLLLIWDLRTSIPEGYGKSENEVELNSLSFNPYNDWIVATGAVDKTLPLFDMRKLPLPVHALRSHVGDVFKVEWDPNHASVLASASADRRIMIWDLNRIGKEQPKYDTTSDEPDELLFTHAGHISMVYDMAWNTHKPWVIASVGEDSCIQIWQIAENIYHDNDFA
ncbi:hypothetical protein SAY87_007314 [Trapa incisa]|uniref:Histone-binding protein RBBP4-like N-terminal domain-containing protein n=1 Tax=Trapa incisa TaxID=236973 RepID=A0AAN7Q020_9MYRT|nr:hypothetical protein SAY87_007314 [Trapa incisa]